MKANTLRIIKLYKRIINHIVFNFIIFVSASFILFAADVEFFLNESAKAIIENITSGMFFLFCFEFLSSNIVEEGYFNSIYFYIDLIDLVSLITEVKFIWKAFLKYVDYQVM